MNPRIEALRIPIELVERLSREARSCYPREACGFLLGEYEGAEASVRRVLEAENRARRADRFLIDARDVFEAMRLSRYEGQELLGVYHSHPDAAPDPSATDRADAWHEWLYLIVSVASSASVASTAAASSSVSVASTAAASSSVSVASSTAITPAAPETSSSIEASRHPNMACWRWDGERFAAVRLRCDAETGEVTP